MDSINYLEWIGYLGSVIVAISLTMTSMVKLRWFNLLGALIFTIYGLAIGAIPVALVNGFITIIDIYYLFVIYTSKDYFKVLEIEENNSYLTNFVKYYSKEIPKDFPNYKVNSKGEKVAFLILRDMAVAGVFIGRKIENSALEIELDYAIPQYRDFKTGDYLFNHQQEKFKSKGIDKIIVYPFSKSQGIYYKKVGFKQYNDKGAYVKSLE